jgi:hypothetical protein
LHRCSFQACDYSADLKCDVKLHEAGVHGVGFDIGACQSAKRKMEEWEASLPELPCGFGPCEYSTRQAAALEGHMESAHGIKRDDLVVETVANEELLSRSAEGKEVTQEGDAASGFPLAANEELLSRSAVPPPPPPPLPRSPRR